MLMVYGGDHYITGYANVDGLSLTGQRKYMDTGLTLKRKCA